MTQDSNVNAMYVEAFDWLDHHSNMEKHQPKERTQSCQMTSKRLFMAKKVLSMIKENLLIVSLSSFLSRRRDYATRTTSNHTC